MILACLFIGANWFIEGSFKKKQWYKQWYKYFYTNILPDFFEFGYIFPS